MGRSLAWRQLRAVAVLPGTATLFVPAAIVWSGGVGAVPPATRVALVITGAASVLLGLALVVKTVRLFSEVGEGTLAPWDTTRKLVVRGIYRFVRNPMITGVMLVLLGEAALCASVGILVWLALFATVNAIYIPLSEEPRLARRFGEAYVEYKRNVPRWIPRLRPWTPPAADA